LVGADVVMTTSSLLRQGPDHMATLLAGLDQWLDARGFTSLKHVRGIMSQRSLRDPQAFERANYIKIPAGIPSARSGNDPRRGPYKYRIMISIVHEFMILF